MTIQNQSTAPLVDPYKKLPTTPSLNYTPANFTPLPVNQSTAPLSNSTPVAPKINTNTPVNTSAPYTVRSGDTLSAIAGRNNMSLKDLLAINPQYQANPNLIRPGESINLQDPNTPNYTPDPAQGQNYTPDPAQQLNYTPLPEADRLNYTPAPNQSMLNYTPDPNYGLNYTPLPEADRLNYTPLPKNNVVYPSTPTAPTAPSTPRTTTPVIPEVPTTTTDGQTINPNTGEVTTAQASAQSVGGASSTGAPATPNISSFVTSPGYEAAIKGFEGNLELTSEEIENQRQINMLEESFRKAYTGEANRPIPLEFITGRQQHLEQRNLDLLQPLQAKAALLQAKRTAALEASKFRVEQEGSKLDRERAANQPIAGTSFYDPVTKKFIQAPSEKAADQFTLNEGQIRYDANGQIVAANTGGTTQTDMVSSDAAYWASLINAGKAKLSEVPSDIRTEVARAQATLGGLSKESQDAINQAGVVMGFVDQAAPMINAYTTGVAGKAQALIPGTPAYNLDRVIDTIKANVGFSALQAMRAASPTGGALGQVSEMENRLLQATLGSLDIGQSPTQLRANLEKVKLHFTNLINILNQEAQPLGGGTDADGGFDW